MAPKKKQTPKVVIPHDARDALDPATHIRPSRAYSAARFFSVLVSSLLLSTICFTLTAGLNRDDLALISKHLEGWEEVGGLLAWRAAEIGLSWGLGFDSE